MAVKYVNPKNSKEWVTAREDIEPAGFINVLSLQDGDVIDIYHREGDKWKKVRNGLYLSNGQIYVMGYQGKTRKG